MQRAHRLGKKRRVQLLSLVQLSPDLCPQKKSEFLHAKKKLKENAIYKSAFITEGLTPLRVKLLKYVKEECEDNFVLAIL